MREFASDDDTQRMDRRRETADENGERPDPTGWRTRQSIDREDVGSLSDDE